MRVRGDTLYGIEERRDPIVRHGPEELECYVEMRMVREGRVGEDRGGEGVTQGGLEVCEAGERARREG